jgi:hypothetical protein
MYLFVAAAPLAKARRQHDLMRPAAINARWRKLASPTHLQTAA